MAVCVNWGGPSFVSLYNKDQNGLGSKLRPLIFGNFHGCLLRP